jgi:predicted O-linked N-acetylglucosamine transferase (SPINDLY family)
MIKIKRFKIIKNYNFIMKICLLIIFLLVSFHISNSLLLDKIKDSLTPNQRKLIQKLTKSQSNKYRNKMVSLYNERKLACLTYINDLEEKYGTLLIDVEVPSFYSYKGVLLVSPGIRDPENAIIYLQKAVSYFPNDTRTWINLGEILSQQFRLEESTEAYYQAVSRGDHLALSRLLKVKGWSNSWKDFEYFGTQLEKDAKGCFYSNYTICSLDSATGLEYAHINGNMQKLIYSKSPNAITSKLFIPKEDVPPFWNKNNNNNKNRLKVGIISADFGIHPVATLIRGFIQFVNMKNIELYCFAISPQMSWWGSNISATVEHFILLDKLDTYDAAALIASYGIEILIDLNGHTVNTGLQIMTHQPAKIQMSFLGLPTTTGATFIDFYIGDHIALPAEHSSHFLEKIVLMKTCYIANDYAQLRGKVLSLEGNPMPRKSLDTDKDIESATILFATLSNSQKYEPNIFQVWMNILQKFSGSMFTFSEHSGTSEGFPHLRSYAKFYGVDSDRLVMAPQIPWIHHVETKTAFDLILDTPIKNGHTTGLDGIWAGIPSVSLGGGSVMQSRAAESIANSLESEYGIIYSLKEYENLIFRLHPSIYSKAESFMKIGNSLQSHRLKTWRRNIEYQRRVSSLFDTRTWSTSFSSLLQAVWEVSHITNSRKAHRLDVKWKTYHVFAAGVESTGPRFIPVELIDENSTPATAPILHPKPPPKRKIVEDEDEQEDSNVMTSKCINDDVFINSPMPNNFFEKDEYIMINVGGICSQDGWYNVNGNNISCPDGMGGTDIVREMHNLVGFPDNSIAALYASHILEHTKIHTVEDTLKEWYRVIKPGGLVFISVPNLRVLAR